MSGEANRNQELLRARAASIPELIDKLVRRGLPELGSLDLVRRELTVTGAGIAEGPARFLTHLLGRQAQFTPVSEYAERPQQGDLRVVFSQALSPHARLSLEARHPFRDTLLFTSAPPASVASLDTPRLRAIRLEPFAPEDGLLLRVVGPAVARAAALLFAQKIASGDSPAVPPDLGSIVGTAYDRGLRTAQEIEAKALLGPVVFVTQGDHLDWSRALAWKWMEGLWAVEPPVWDVLQFAHGPLQAVYERALTLITLEPPGSAPLFERMFRTLDQGRHLVVRSLATLPGALGVFEHDVVLNALLSRALTAVDRDLSHWPALDRDGPLYRWTADPVGGAS